MEKVSLKTIRELYDRDEDNQRLALTKAKAAISAVCPTNKTIPMSDAECLAYSQAIFVAENQRQNLADEQKYVYREMKNKYNIYKKEDIESKPEYQKITKSLENSKKAGMNLFKQALMRNPDDEQLRLLCAGSLAYDSTPSQDTIFVKILEDPEIAKDTALSIRIIDAAMQWRQAINNKGLGNYDDINVAKEFITKNFSADVMSASIPHDKNSASNEHPSYERGVHLLGKLEQRIKGSEFKHQVVANETMSYLSDMNEEILQTSFENSPRFTKAYSNLVQSYKEAYVRAAMENLDYVPSYHAYDRVMTKKAAAKTVSSGRTDY